MDLWDRNERKTPMFKQALAALAIQQPAAKSWSNRTSKLLKGYCREVFHDKPGKCPVDVEIIYSAAWHLWHATEGQPCWSKLDVQQWFDQVIDPPVDNERMRTNAAGTMSAFYCFLVKHKHLSPAHAEPIVNQLMPRFTQGLSEYLFGHADAAEGREAAPAEGAPAALPN